MDINELKQKAALLLKERESSIRALGGVIFDNPETGFKEIKTAEIIKAELKRHGIPYSDGLSISGVKAALGNSGYHIALAADMDAVLTGGKAIHSCGHSIQSAALLAVMGILNEMRICEKLGGRVSFIAAPAEEFIELDYRNNLIKEGKISLPSGKQDMICKGVFDDIDCVIQIHVMEDENYAFDIGTSLAGFCQKKAIFHGRASHSGAAAHLGRNALNAASLTLNALAFTQEQFPREAGVHIHPVLTGGAMSVNVIPDIAILETYIRAADNEWLIKASKSFDSAAKHCAAALDLEADVETCAGYLPFKQSPELCETVYNNMLSICDAKLIARDRVSGASGDIGDLSALLPCVQLGFSGISGRIHSLDFSIKDHYHVYVDTALVVLGTVLDLLSEPRFQVKYGDYAARKESYVKQMLSC